MSKNAWLTCDLADGMFSNEVTVCIRTADGPVSLFAPREFVRDAQHGGPSLAVTVIDEDARFGLVRLPATPVDGPPVVRVERTALLRAQP
jgi:hypothetical protein